MNPAPRIHFLLVRRTPPGLGPVLAEVYERLQAKGVEVDDHIPEEQLISSEELIVRHDLYVLKSHTELALSMAGTLCALGARLLNPHRSCLLTQDKITSTKLLSDAGVPVPCSWVTDDYGLLVPLLAEGPLIAKPHRGHLGKGIRILRSAEDLDLLSPAEGPFLFQRYLETDSEDIKTYVVGRRAFAVTKRFSPHSYQVHGYPIELDARTRDIVLKCGEVLGLHLYGVDLVRTERGPSVVDVNYFPGIQGGSRGRQVDSRLRLPIRRRRRASAVGPGRSRVMTKICFLEQPGRRSPDSVIPLIVRRLGSTVAPWRCWCRRRRRPYSAGLRWTRTSICGSLTSGFATASRRRYTVEVCLYQRLLRYTAGARQDRHLDAPHGRRIADTGGVLCRQRRAASCRRRGLPHRRQAELRAAGATDLGGKECTELERLDPSYGDIFAQEFVKGKVST